MLFFIIFFYLTISNLWVTIYTFPITEKTTKNKFPKKTWTYNYPFPIYNSLLFVIEAVFISNKLQSTELEQHFEKFHNHTVRLWKTVAK